MNEDEANVLVDDLYRARQSARWLLGDTYDAKMAEIGQMLTRIAGEKGAPVLHIALDATQQMPKLFDRLQVLAAAVELEEKAERSER